MAGRPSDYAIEIPRTGQHPLKPGAVRLSTLIAIVIWWLIAAIAVTQFMEPTARNFLGALCICFIVTGAMWGAGYKMTEKNPFHPEVFHRSILRTLRGRNNLET